MSAYLQLQGQWLTSLNDQLMTTVVYASLDKACRPAVVSADIWRYCQAMTSHVCQIPATSCIATGYFAVYTFATKHTTMPNNKHYLSTVTTALISAVAANQLTSLHATSLTFRMTVARKSQCCVSLTNVMTTKRGATLTTGTNAVPPTYHAVNHQAGRSVERQNSRAVRLTSCPRLAGTYMPTCYRPIAMTRALQYQRPIAPTDRL